MHGLGGGLGVGMAPDEADAGGVVEAVRQQPKLMQGAAQDEAGSELAAGMGLLGFGERQPPVLSAAAVAGEPAHGGLAAELLLEVQAETPSQGIPVDLADEGLDAVDAGAESEEVARRVAEFPEDAPVVPGEVGPGGDAGVAVTGGAAEHGVPGAVDLPLEVEPEVVPGQRQDHRVDEGGVEELAAAAVGVAVGVEVVALVDHAGDDHDVAVGEGLLPGEFGDAEAVHARPDAGGVGGAAQVAGGGLGVTRVAEAGLGGDLRTDPSGGAVGRVVVDRPLGPKTQRVEPEVVVALPDIGERNPGQGLRQRIPETELRGPVAGLLDRDVEGRGRQEGARLDGGVAQFVMARQVGPQPGLVRGEEIQVVVAGAGFLLPPENGVGNRAAAGGGGHLAAEALARAGKKPGREGVRRHRHRLAERADEKHFGWGGVGDRRGRGRADAGRRQEDREAGQQSETPGVHGEARCLGGAARTEPRPPGQEGVHGLRAGRRNRAGGRCSVSAEGQGRGTWARCLGGAARTEPRPPGLEAGR
jgi:hypothetical protein